MIVLAVYLACPKCVKIVRYSILVRALFFIAFLPPRFCFSVLITINAEQFEMPALGIAGPSASSCYHKQKIIRPISRRSNGWKHCLTFDTSESR